MIITLKNCLISECGGGDHKWEFERPTLRELKRIQDVTGLDVEEWQNGLNGVGGLSTTMIDATLALVDVLHRRDGVRVAFDDIDVDLENLDFEFDAAEQAEQGGQDGQPEDGEGKDPAQTEVSLPPADEAPVPASASGPSTEAESPPKSWPTPQTSGGGSASP